MKFMLVLFLFRNILYSNGEKVEWKEISKERMREGRGEGGYGCVALSSRLVFFGREDWFAGGERICGRAGSRVAISGLLSLRYLAGVIGIVVLRVIGIDGRSLVIRVLLILILLIHPYV
jgi:hypothetical protein